MTAEELFESPAALIAWAYEDTQRFCKVEEAFFGPDSHQRIIEFDPKTGRNAHRIQLIGEPPTELRKLASHIVNDLRHALDQAFFAAAKHFGWQPTKNQTVLYFPWSRDLADLKGRIRNIPVEIHDIIMFHEPYCAQNDGTGGDDMIRELNNIAGPNKHEAVLSSFVSASMKSMELKWDGDWIVPYWEDMWDAAKQQLTLAYFPVGTDGDYDVEIALFVTFRDVPALKGLPVRTLFAKWGRYVGSVVSKLEKRVAEDIAATH